MIRFFAFIWLLLSAWLVLAVYPAFAQEAAPQASYALSTAFTYQGRLASAGTPSNGVYDLRFQLFDSLSAGAQVGPTLDLSGITVVDGLLTVDLDFGDVFDGSTRYLAISVRAQGVADFTALTPRQRLAATPYALYAARAAYADQATHATQADSAAQATHATQADSATQADTAANATNAANASAAPWSGISGIPAGFADGIDQDTTYAAGNGLKLTGGTFAVDPAAFQTRISQSCATGSSIRAVNQDGSVVCETPAQAGAAWLLGGNGGTNGTTDYLGTSDDTPLQIRVNNQRALRIEPTENTPNLIGGAEFNVVTAGAKAAVIGGGGTQPSPNRVTDSYGTVAGGAANLAGNDSGSTEDHTYASVGGGFSNQARGQYTTIGGGVANQAEGQYSTVAGGIQNTTAAIASAAAIGGGQGNQVNVPYTTIPGGYGAVATVWGQQAYAAGIFDTAGDAQTATYVLRGETTDATPFTLYAAQIGQRLSIANNHTVLFDGMVVGRSSIGVVGGYWIRGLVTNLNGVVSFQGTPTVTAVGEGNVAWDVALFANNSNDSLDILVTGAASNDIRWVATVRTVEVAW